MKVNAEEGYDAVKVGFFFRDASDGSLCHIEKTWMEKEEKYEEIQVSSSNEVLVPLDSHLRRANPLVYVHTPTDKQCDFSTVVHTREELSGNVSYDTVSNIIPQMQSMLENLGGMFAGWFTPEITGLTLEFDRQVEGVISLANGDQVQINEGKAIITLEQIGVDGWMKLPAETIRVLPYIPAGK